MQISSKNSLCELKKKLSRGATFPAEAADALIQRRAAFERLLPVTLSAPLRGDAVEASTAPVLQLQMLDNEVLRLRVRVRPLEEAGTFYGQRVYNRNVGIAAGTSYAVMADGHVEEVNYKSEMSHGKPASMTWCRDSLPVDIIGTYEWPD